MSEEANNSKSHMQEDDDERHRREEAERRAKRKVSTSTVVPFNYPLASSLPTVISCLIFYFFLFFLFLFQSEHTHTPIYRQVKVHDQKQKRIDNARNIVKKFCGNMVLLVVVQVKALVSDPKLHHHHHQQQYQPQQ
jgi:Ca2+/H+ antiporter